MLQVDWALFLTSPHGPWNHFKVEVMLAPSGALTLSPAKIVLHSEEPPPTRDDPIDVDQYGSRLEGW